MRRLRRSILLTLFAACSVMLATAGGPEADSAGAAPSAPDSGETAPVGPAQAAGLDVVEGRVVVRLKHSLAETFVAEAAIAHGGAVTKAVGDGFLLVIDLPEARVAQLITVLERNPLVAQAGRDLVVSAFDVPNDPSYEQQWHLQDSAGGIDAEGAWDIAPSRGQGVVVAVIDTGVAFESHSAPGVFGQKVFQRAPDFAGVTFVAPFDFIEEDSHANDEHGHGTHVAMTIAQAT
ncbi:MAG: S8 family serine peptidase, partial [Dehalococcoidia bacterium]